MEVLKLLEELINRGGSDLHIQAGNPAVLRVVGDLIPLDGEVLTREDTESIFRQIAQETIRTELEDEGSVDFSYTIPDRARFRVNAFRQQGSLALVFRLIPLSIPTFEDLGLPAIISEIASEERGLILVVGVTGSGKSTTLAAIVEHINRHQCRRIITIEDPIEYVHSSKKSLISQRELGRDARSFSAALRHVLRQDPDMILVGELRDLETIRTAIRAAETGHLVLSTLHTTDTVQTLDRMIGYFPSEEQEFARQEVAMNLRAVIAQRLIARADGKGRVPAVEILRNTSLVQKMLLNNKIRELHQVVTNREQGMQTFDQCLVELVKSKTISEQDSIRYAANPSALKRILAGGYSDSDRGGIISF